MRRHRRGMYIDRVCGLIRVFLRQVMEGIAVSMIHMSICIRWIICTRWVMPKDILGAWILTCTRYDVSVIKPVAGEGCSQRTTTFMSNQPITEKR